jgi:hypothetical protein
MIERLDTYLVIPLAFSALTTGVVVSLTTKWGLSRYWWVLCKLMLTGAVILFSTHGVGRWVQVSIEATVAATTPSPVGAPLAYGAALNLVAFLFMTWLSIAKPWKLTPWATRPRANSEPDGFRHRLQRPPSSRPGRPESARREEHSVDTPQCDGADREIRRRP